MKKTFLSVFFCLAGWCGSAEAANDTIATALQAILGEKRSQVLAPGEAGYYGIILQPDRTYAAFCWVPTLEGQAPVIQACLVDVRNAADVVRSTATIGEPTPKGGWGATIEMRRGDPSDHFVRISNNTLTAPQTVSFVILETTLASPWFFVSSSGGYESYVEIHNHTWGFVTVAVDVFLDNGDPIERPASAATAQRIVTLGPNRTFWVPITSLGITEGWGSVRIRHFGMPGAIVANTTVLSAVTGLAFDVPFSPRMVWSTF